MRELTFGSLFAGIGGFDLGLERAGMVCKWQVEIDPFCQKVLAKHWPNVRRYGDVRECGKHNLETVDVICGGFPCQPVSDAGKMAAQNDERWLWPHFKRIIRSLRPKYALIENVPGILGRGFDDVLCDLAEIGYDAEWQTLPAAVFGAPHIRARVFAVAYPNSIRRVDAPEIFCKIPGEALPQQTQKGWSGNYERGTGGAVRLFPDAWSRRVADGFPSELDKHRVKGCGNAVVPQVAEWIGRQIIKAHSATAE